MQTRTRMAASLTQVGIGGLVAELAGAPWWLIVGAYGCIAMGLIVMLVQTIFPQESVDRLEWWRDRRRHQRLAANKNADSAKAPRPALRRESPDHADPHRRGRSRP
ncbi:hypothetical protein [Actinomadura sp. WMMA1423]|uniref:hypothetical protein n=1 Tax=Actinomadura sp. WMMA1423 TaxID=2591108 RepID=UPI00114716F3|nr:hypothetical protein [Actinomadura sp. WMMA1423]